MLQSKADKYHRTLNAECSYSFKQMMLLYDVGLPSFRQYLRNTIVEWPSLTHFVKTDDFVALLVCLEIEVHSSMACTLRIKADVRIESQAKMSRSLG